MELYCDLKQVSLYTPSTGIQYMQSYLIIFFQQQTSYTLDIYWRVAKEFFVMVHWHLRLMITVDDDDAKELWVFLSY